MEIRPGFTDVGALFHTNVGAVTLLLFCHFPLFRDAPP